MCLALKYELHQRFGPGSDRRFVHQAEEEFQHKNRDDLLERVDSSSKVAETPVVEEAKVSYVNKEVEDDLVHNDSKFADPLVEEEDGAPENMVGVTDVCEEEEDVFEVLEEVGETGGVQEGELVLEEGEEDEGYVLERGDRVEVEQGLEANEIRKFYSMNKSLFTKPTTLRFNHVGASTGLFSLNRKKKRMPITRVDQISSSRTDSIEPDIGKEFTSKQHREQESRLRKEAEATLEVGRQVGVTFDPNCSSAIEKLLAMDV